MNGAIADPSVINTKKLNKTKKNNIGANHHFLRSFKKDKNSINIENFDIFAPYLNIDFHNY